MSKFPIDRRPDNFAWLQNVALDDMTMTSSNNSTGRCYQIKKLFRKMGLALLILAVVLAVSGFLYYIITHRPVRPSIKILSMSVSPIDISPDNFKLTANWTIELEVTNPKKTDSINYHEFEVSVLYYGAEFLSTTKLAPFQQNPRNQTELIAEPKALLQNLTDGLVGSAIREDLDGDGVVSFDVMVKLGYDYDSELGHPNKRLHHKNYVCGDLEVRYPSDDDHQWSDGRMLGTSKRCEYYKNNN